MDLSPFLKLQILFLLASSLCLQSLGDGGRSVLFLDSPNHRYLRDRRQIDGMSPSEIASTISVLLGFAPSFSLPTESAAKLDKVLLPNPFDKPHAVLVIEVRGTEAPPSTIAHSNAGALSYLSSKIHGSGKAEIELPDEDEISIVPLDEPSGCVGCIDKEFADLANILGGSYVGSVESMDGELTFTLASGTSLKLHVSKQSDMNFALSLASLVRGIKKAAEMHEDFSGSIQSPAELLMGGFTGIEALKENGPEIVQKGLELFQTTLTRMFDLLQKQYEGKIVGVILFDNENSPDLLPMLDVKFPPRAARWLEEVGPSNTTTIQEVLLVRLILAWITGIILLVATLIGVYLLLNMTLTRDTLLYANVKLD